MKILCEKMPTLTTDGERLLYKILQRANLCQYFDLFISQGGDDVRQLCEAGEEEFLEIMALVGMASKPLHVRRLQKALHEWIANPGLFQSSDYLRTFPLAPKGSIVASVPLGAGREQQQHIYSGNESRGSHEGDTRRAGWDESYDLTSHRRSSPYNDPDSDQLFSEWQQSCPSPVAQAETSIQLTEAQISALESSASELSKTLPLYAPRPLNMKKPVDKEIDEVMNLPEEYPNRIDLLRKYSAIYGRFDSKKSAEKVLYMHQVLVNEAAAQLCKHRPTLLTRREDLFPLARQAVRNSGLQYSRPQVRARDCNAGDEGTPVKHAKLDSQPHERSYSEHCIDSSELDDSQTAASVSSQSPGNDTYTNTNAATDTGKSAFKLESNDAESSRNGNTTMKNTLTFDR